MSNEQMLHEEIESGFEVLSNLEKGGEEYKAVVDAQTKLLDRAIEIDRLNIEHEEKQQQLEEEKKDRRWKHGIAIGTALTGLFTTFFWSREYLRFEETGTVSTQGHRKMLDKAINYFFKR